MILAIDAGNTRIGAGVYPKGGGPMRAGFCLSAALPRTADEYARDLRSFLDARGIDPKEIAGCVISSVVPRLDRPIGDALAEILPACRPLWVGHGVKTGLDIRIDHHTELGSDIVANAVAASERLERPFAVIDLGTATTVTAVNRTGELIGVMIIPGVQSSADALAQSCAELPMISLVAPESLLGKNTADSMASGCIYGAAAMIDGILARLREQLGDDLSVIACGGMAERVIPFTHTKEPIPIAPNLTLDGLAAIWRLNQRRRGEK